MNELIEIATIGARRAGSGEAFVSMDPSAGDVVWRGPAFSPADAHDAVSDARAAFPAWAETSPAARCKIAVSYLSVLEARRVALAALIARETGKPRWDAEAEVADMIRRVGRAIEAYDERSGERELKSAAGRAIVRHRPHGVMVVLGPYCDPGRIPNDHITPALIAGDAVVFKPSRFTPAVGVALQAAWEEAGLPPDVLTLVQGGRTCGRALLEADIDAVAFTGTAENGLNIHRRFADRPDVMVALHMGGSNPLVVWDAADAEAAAGVVLQSAFATTGQNCRAARRLILPEGEAGDAVLEALVRLCDRLRVGAWDDEPPPFMGPMISAMAADRVLAAEAALIQIGGRAFRFCERGERAPTFITPAVVDLTGVDGVPDAEVFGPLLQVYRVATFESAIVRANATRFGLAAGLISDDAERWARFRSAVRAGALYWNRPMTSADAGGPSGGVGFSGVHRPSGAYAADASAYPVACLEADTLAPPAAIGLEDD